MTTSKTARMPCKNCGKDIFCDMIIMESKQCTKKKCWLRKPKALTIAADVAGCSVWDFIPPESGGIILHKEPERPSTNIDHFPIDEYYNLHGMTYDC